MASQAKVLVTGATGRVGGEVVAQLAAAGVPVRAMSRRTDAGMRQNGTVEWVAGDLTDPPTLAAALDGIERIFLVFPSVTGDPVARELVTMLAHSSRRIVYLSTFGVPDAPDPSAEPDGGILGSHAYLEGLIAAAAAEYTFVRPSGFAANTLGWAGQLRRSEVLRWFHPQASRAPVHEADLAAVGVKVLVEDGHNRRAYHLTGPEQLTQEQQLDAIGNALGRTLRFAELDADRIATELFPGMPAEAVAGIVGAHAEFIAHPEQVTDGVRQLLGRPALRFAQWARDHATDFARTTAGISV